MIAATQSNWAGVEQEVCTTGRTLRGALGSGHSQPSCPAGFAVCYVARSPHAQFLRSPGCFLIFDVCDAVQRVQCVSRQKFLLEG